MSPVPSKCRRVMAVRLLLHAGSRLRYFGVALLFYFILLDLLQIPPSHSPSAQESANSRRELEILVNALAWMSFHREYGHSRKYG